MGSTHWRPSSLSSGQSSQGNSPHIAADARNLSDHGGTDEKLQLIIALAPVRNFVEVDQAISKLALGPRSQFLTRLLRSRTRPTMCSTPRTLRLSQVEQQRLKPELSVRRWRSSIRPRLSIIGYAAADQRRTFWTNKSYSRKADRDGDDPG